LRGREREETPMSTEYCTIPKFRKAKRLVRWVGDNGYRQRLPRDREEVFFKEHSEGKLNLNFIASYSAYVGPIPEMEFMLMGQGEHIIPYAKNCRSHGRMIGDVLRDSITDEASLLTYARNFGRLPPHLEERITLPGIAVSYSETVVRGRLPEEMELRIFSRESAYQVFQYAKNCRFLPEGHLHECLKGSPNAIVEHMKWIRNSASALPDDLRDSLVGDDDSLLEWAKLHGRLPEHLERTLTKPKVCLEYATRVLRGRLPPEVESCLLNDHKAAISYAFNVIRGFAPCRLPEEIHASIVMKSFEHTDDGDIKKYIAACDSDPNRMGNK
jgi:hypothetical protein